MFAVNLHSVGDRVGSGGNKSVLDEFDYSIDRPHPAICLSLGQIDKKIAHDPPKLTESVGGGSCTNQLGQEAPEQGVEQGKKGINSGLTANDRGAVGRKRIGIQIGIKSAGAMPEHGLHAVFGVFEVDPVVDQMAPDLGWVFVTIKVFEQWKGQQELLLGLEDQVDAVGIQHLSIALEHIHHLD